MYNRYIPNDTNYTRIVEETPPRPVEEVRQEPLPPQQEERPRRPAAPQQEAHPHPPGFSQPPTGGGGFRLPPFLSGKEGLTALFSGKEGGGLSSLLKALHLESVDTGDILLLLIILFLLVEGDDLELVIALGLVLLMGLGEKGEPPPSE